MDITKNVKRPNFKKQELWSLFDKEINEEDLIIPHYDWHNRLFVIQPLYELLNKPLDKANYEIHEQKIIKVGKIEF